MTTLIAYRERLLAQLAEIERQIESYKATLGLLEIERQRVKYQLNEHVRSVPRMDT